MTNPHDSSDPSAATSLSWLLPPQGQPGIVIRIPPDMDLREDVRAAIDELIQALQTPMEGELAPRTKCNKIYDGECATLFVCHIGPG